MLLIWQRAANWAGGVVVFVRNLGRLDLGTLAYIVRVATRWSRDGDHYQSMYGVCGKQLWKGVFSIILILLLQIIDF